MKILALVGKANKEAKSITKDKRKPQLYSLPPWHPLLPYGCFFCCHSPAPQYFPFCLCIIICCQRSYNRLLEVEELELMNCNFWLKKGSNCNSIFFFPMESEMAIHWPSEELHDWVFTCNHFKGEILGFCASPWSMRRLRSWQKTFMKISTSGFRF
jgi:hypothetical protein